MSQPGTVDLPWARWEVDVHHTSALPTLPGAAVGYSVITVGRLITTCPIRPVVHGADCGG
ncbi:hypothetical protein ABZ721_33135 [Streptomyces sp. NPDC006733]|uniref:hypothetical protein n=1 Tax=Streptomyces sp. NPDC006733 TaxID=3155460 RepID=UPI00341151CC